MARKAGSKETKTLEQRLWDAADALRGNQEPSEYKHVVLGLVFLKYISDRFEARRQRDRDRALRPELRRLHPERSAAPALPRGPRRVHAATTSSGCPPRPGGSYIQDRAKLPRSVRSSTPRWT